MYMMDKLSHPSGAKCRTLIKYLYSNILYLEGGQRNYPFPPMAFNRPNTDQVGMHNAAFSVISELNVGQNS